MGAFRSFNAAPLLPSADDAAPRTTTPGVQRAATGRASLSAPYGVSGDGRARCTMGAVVLRGREASAAEGGLAHAHPLLVLLDGREVGSAREARVRR